ncbi:radical SAM protein [Magnetospirillum sp. SS-4]|uniref:B12-binding domain-containing radical SAM protein n=1 Tax=Magnetospirillum sp. SS-4 TaxID=2681465 RepID=UPI0013861040|nr:radical SAM protein [Magnetospirillum sp. SS-4]CAA7625696.1 hypothetical protein MTBSS4_520016 [Magnetospirillum sp. SS-4]
MASRFLLATCTLAPKWHPTINVENGHYPLGMASLYAVVEQAGHQADLLYMVTDPIEVCVARVLDTIREKDIQVLGLSVITDGRVATYRVIEAVREEFPHVRVILGGIHVTVMHEQILTQYPHVVAVRGEGELTLVDLLDAMETGRDLAEVQGIAFWRDGKVVRTAERPQIADMDSLPMPRHDLFFTPNRVYAQLLTSRGCPFACSFCVLDSISLRKIRAHSAMRVVDEIEMVLTNHPQVQVFHVYDDQFFADNKRVIEICDEIVRRGIKTKFICQGRVKPLSREMVLALERAGFLYVTLGLESGAQEVLKRCNKKIHLKDVERAMGLFAGTSIEVSVLLIIGLPGEDENTIQETIDFCQTLQKIKYHVYDMRIQDLFVYPGTEIYHNYRDAGKITDEFWLGDEDCPRFDAFLSSDDFYNFRKRMLDAMCIYRIFTEDGFKAQRDMIPHFLHYYYGLNPGVLRYRDHFDALILNAINHAIENKRLEFMGDPRQIAPGHAFVTLSVARQLGNDAGKVLNLLPFPDGLQIPILVNYAYANRFGLLTDAFTEAVTTYLEEAFATGDGRLNHVAPHHATELMALNFAPTPAVAAHQRLVG